MRYFIELAYNGSRYHGWQKQRNSSSVQATVEKAFSTILNTSAEITGCGRTDTGVHASQYYAHLDYPGAFPEGFLSRCNKFLPADIAVRRVFRVGDEAHARFDAIQRSYEYHIVYEKNPFGIDTTWHYYLAKELDVEALNRAAGLLMSFEEFKPFCKTNSDVKTMKCDLRRSVWTCDEQAGKIVYHVSSDRFLRGMVRLIVGMCLNVAAGKLDLQNVQSAMEQQKMLNKSWSVPPDGLFLSEVLYPAGLDQYQPI